MKLSRRDFLKTAVIGIGGLLVRPSWVFAAGTEFPKADLLGRVVEGRVDLKARPDIDSPTVGVLYGDAVVPWLREVVGRNPYRLNQRWVEAPGGYIWSPYLQPVRNLPNPPVVDLPDNPSLGVGMWAEVTQPYADLILDNPPGRSPWSQNNQQPRLYYSQVTWIDKVKTDSQGQVYYRVNERYGSYGDIFWALGEAFRPVTTEELAPIHPETSDKRIRVNITTQTLSCFEGKDEVYFARISSGLIFYNSAGKLVEEWMTPIGNFPIWRKLISVHMSGGTTGGGWDLPAVAWTSLFVGNGVAIHSTYWHNNFGEPMSRGCVNSRPEDAKWVFRWSQPPVAYNPGDITVQWPGGTTVEVFES